MNQLVSFNDKVKDHNITNKQEYYSWDPHIDWDKFKSYEEEDNTHSSQTLACSGDSCEIVDIGA